MNAKTTLATAMASAFAEFEAAAKDAKNPHFKSNYATLSSVVDAIKPALIANRLFFTQSSHDVQGGVCVETIIHHESGESFSCGKLFVPASKNDAQGFGSALTYCRRYSLMTAFGIPAEDDDGNAAAKSAPNNGRRAAANETGELVSDAQLTKLQDEASAVGADLQRFCNYMGVSSLKTIPASRFDEALDALQAKRKPAPTLEAAQ